MSKTETNVALREYRSLKRATVPEHCIELAKKVFRPIMLHFKDENVGALSVSPLSVVVWIVQDAEFVPAPAWILPTGSQAIEASRCESWWVARTCPRLFTREHAYNLFSGGQGGREGTSFELWDYQDRDFSDMTCDQAKVCSNKRLTVEGALNNAREVAACGVASGA